MHAVAGVDPRPRTGRECDRAAVDRAPSQYRPPHVDTQRLSHRILCGTTRQRQLELVTIASGRVGSALVLVLEETDGEMGSLFAEPLAQTVVATGSTIGGYRALLASNFAPILWNAGHLHLSRSTPAVAPIATVPSDTHSLHDERRRASGFLASAGSRKGKDWQCVPVPSSQLGTKR
jgi:hypothetical protein